MPFLSDGHFLTGWHRVFRPNTEDEVQMAGFNLTLGWPSAPSTIIGRWTNTTTVPPTPQQQHSVARTVVFAKYVVWAGGIYTHPHYPPSIKGVYHGIHYAEVYGARFLTEICTRGLPLSFTRFARFKARPWV
jgi:hypothetical protein